MLTDGYVWSAAAAHREPVPIGYPIDDALGVDDHRKCSQPSRGGHADGGRVEASAPGIGRCSRAALKVWLDKDDLAPGRGWQGQLEQVPTKAIACPTWRSAQNPKYRHHRSRALLVSGQPLAII